MNLAPSTSEKSAKKKWASLSLIVEERQRDLQRTRVTHSGGAERTRQSRRVEHCARRPRPRRRERREPHQPLRRTLPARGPAGAPEGAVPSTISVSE